MSKTDFDSCSDQQIRRLSKKCLSNRAPDNLYEIIKAGLVWDPNSQCKQRFGNNASFCPVCVQFCIIYHLFSYEERTFSAERTVP